MSAWRNTSSLCLSSRFIFSVKSLSFFFSFCHRSAQLHVRPPHRGAYIIEFRAFRRFCNDTIDLCLVFSKPGRISLSLSGARDGNIATYPAFIIEGPASRLKKLAVSCEAAGAFASCSFSVMAEIALNINFQCARGIVENASSCAVLRREQMVVETS